MNDNEPISQILGFKVNHILNNPDFWKNEGCEPPKNKKMWLVSKTGFSQKNIYKVFNGESNINLERAGEIARALGVPLWELFTKTGSCTIIDPLLVERSPTRLFARKVKYYLKSKEILEKISIPDYFTNRYDWLAYTSLVARSTLYNVLDVSDSFEMTDIDNIQNITIDRAEKITTALKKEFYLFLTPTYDDLGIDLKQYEKKKDETEK